MKTISCVFIFIFLTSCSEIKDRLFVLMGNYDFQRGGYQQANLHYLKVLAGSRYTPWVLYNLGSVYNALGEANTALMVWNQVDGKNPELLFRLNFNKGVLQLQQGLYQEAYESFKKCLFVYPSNTDAKKNLEISLKKIQSLDKLLPPRSVVRVEPLVSSDLENQTLLDHIRRLEGKRWKNIQQKAISDLPSDW